MRLTQVLLGGVVAAGSLLAPAATAAVNCFGTSDVNVCVHTPEVVVDSRTECVYAGGTTCREVEVPTVGTTGRLEVTCGGRLDCQPFP
jgi:hypothetical protein